jgi:outer membrane immunogenic protein
MRKQLSLAALAAAVTLGWAGAAGAADMPVKALPPPPPPLTWNGTYIGINGGYAWGTTNHTDRFGVTTGDFNQTGGLAGVTFGGNWQMGHYVLGFESDLDWADIKGSLNSAALCSVAGLGNPTCFTKIKSFSTERMRAGYDIDGWLLFVTGGAAFGRVQAGQNPCGFVAPNPGLGIGGGNSCGERWRAGWVAGGGIEKMFLPHWSAKIEYLHFDLGNSLNYTPTALPAGANAVKVLERGDMVRVGINYQFDLMSFLR